MYQAKYICKLCGAIKVESRDLKSKEGAILAIGMSPKNPIHECKDGSLGLMDFQGFKKVGEP